MQTQRVKIFFEDEAPRLGCGWRWVSVQIGRKWVRLQDDMGRTARFTLAQYAELKPHEI
jgi:hypothetical protein